MWEENKGFLVVFVGDLGSGKSYSALALAEMIDLEFDVSKVVYKPREFLHALDRCEKGEVIIWDEAGVGIPAREWQTIQNKIISYILQTFRYKNVGIIFTTPSMNLLDAHVRGLMHYVLQVWGHNENNQNVCSLLKIVHDRIRGIVDYEKFIFWDTNRGKEYDPNYIKIGKPSDDLAEEYERLAYQRKEELRQEAIEQLKAFEEGVKKGGIDGRTLRKMVNIVSAFYKAYEVLKEQYGSVRQVALRLGIDPQTLHNWIGWIESNKDLFIKQNSISIDE